MKLWAGVLDTVATGQRPVPQLFWWDKLCPPNPQTENKDLNPCTENRVITEMAMLNDALRG